MGALFVEEFKQQKGEVPMNNDLTRAEEIIESYGCDQSNLIAIMQEI